MTENEETLTAEEKADLADLNRERAETYRLLASLVDREVSAKTCEPLTALAQSVADPEASACERRCVEGLATMGRCLEDFDRELADVLACDYARVFLASGLYNDHAAVPYESIYTSEEGILMQEARDQVRALFREAGVMPERDANIPEDYLPFEFEYMALQADRAAEALEADDLQRAATCVALQEDFLQQHLLSWTDDLIADIDRIAQTPFYHALADAIGGFLGCEAQDVPELLEACGGRPEV